MLKDVEGIFLICLEGLWSSQEALIECLWNKKQAPKQRAVSVCDKNQYLITICLLLLLCGFDYELCQVKRKLLMFVKLCNDKKIFRLHEQDVSRTWSHVKSTNGSLRSQLMSRTFFKIISLQIRRFHNLLTDWLRSATHFRCSF